MKLPPGFPTTHHELTAFYHAKYDAGIQEGRYEPFVYPWGTLGAAIVVMYLLIPHRNSPLLRRARFLAFAWIAGFAAYTIRYCRSRNMAPAFGTGIISAWPVLWAATILVVNDAQLNFQRIKRLEGVHGSSRKVEQNSTLTKIKEHTKEEAQSIANGFSGGKHVTISKEGHLGPGKRHGDFAWQPYPLSPFIERLDWVLDIFCSFRGMGWNWRISSLPPPPKWVQEQLRENSGSDIPRDTHAAHSEMARVYQTRAELLRANLKTFILGYLILDLLKVIVNHDPYFWGIPDRPPPAYLPALLTRSPILLRFYRLAVSQYLIKWSLQTFFSLAPLFFSGVLGPDLIGTRAAPWMYPDTWGSYAHVLDRGLAGWWAGWWHQTFRFGFAEPARKLVALARLDPRSRPAKLLRLVTAFALSGFLHACASYTQPGPTRPLRGPFCFFVLQAAGVAAEMLLVRYLGAREDVWGRLPVGVGRVVRLVYVHVWFYHTAPLLVDDFARGGLWLYEPVPVSPLRALGLGARGDGCWCWGGQWVYLYWGERWWKSGIAF